MLLFGTLIPHDIINFALDDILYTTVFLSLHDIFNVYNKFVILCILYSTILYISLPFAVDTEINFVIFLQKDKQ